MSIAIGPDTTVGALLAAYPDAEEVLIGMAPPFAKLRNPVVRRTIAKVATLEQVARIGGVELPVMIRQLRAATGAGGTDELSVVAAQQDRSDLMTNRIVDDIDADAMLERGVHPIGRVREAVSTLKAGESVLLRSSFLPQPLIETMRQAGRAVHSSVVDGKHLTWFGKD